LGLAYADGLKKLGQTDQLEVLAKLSAQNPEKSRGAPKNSLPAWARRFQFSKRWSRGTADWRTLSALGSLMTSRPSMARRGILPKTGAAAQSDFRAQQHGMSHALEAN
jgi:hypothetical protein